MTRSNGERVGFYLQPIEQERHPGTAVLIEALLEVAQALWMLDKRFAALGSQRGPEEGEDEEALDRVIG